MKLKNKNFLLITHITSLLFVSNTSYAKENLNDLYLKCTQQKIELDVMKAIIKTESSFNPFAIGINTKNHSIKQPTTLDEAKITMKSLLDNGINFDTGLGQINVKNMGWLGLNADNIFDPCNNIRALEDVYLECRRQSTSSDPTQQRDQALSCYNTGSLVRGFNNGYVAKVLNNLTNSGDIQIAKVTVEKAVFEIKKQDVFKGKLNDVFLPKKTSDNET